MAEGIVLERHYVYKYCSPTRSSLMSGRLPTHVNQNNRNNDIEAGSGCDLRYTFLAEKMRDAGYFFAIILPRPAHSLASRHHLPRRMPCSTRIEACDPMS